MFFFRQLLADLSASGFTSQNWANLHGKTRYTHVFIDWKPSHCSTRESHKRLKGNSAWDLHGRLPTMHLDLTIILSPTQQPSKHPTSSYPKVIPTVDVTAYSIPPRLASMCQRNIRKVHCGSLLIRCHL